MSSTFSDFGLLPPILEAIAAMGYEEPTPIQSRSHPFSDGYPARFDCASSNGYRENGSLFIAMSAQVTMPVQWIRKC